MTREQFLELVGHPFEADAHAARLEKMARDLYADNKHWIKQPRSEMTDQQLQVLETIENHRTNMHAWKNEAARRREIHKRADSHLHPLWLRQAGLAELAGRLEALQTAHHAGMVAVFGDYDAPEVITGTAAE